jgi:protoporphyrin/coproporphyrin ferrochelatase
VRAFLAEFLSDPRVVSLPRWLWLPILHGIVLRRRPPAVAQKYHEIWLPEGSPLAVYTRRQAELLFERLNQPVAYAMRYGTPSIAATLPRVGDAVVIPLYPQYSVSTTESVIDCLPPDARVVREFHAHGGYIRALAGNVRRYWTQHGRGELLLMSFHGLPRRGAEIYERQCHATARLLAKQLRLKDAEWRVTFQSRFGYARWLAPYTQPTLEALARGGTKRVDIVCPGFVTDCLETLEEIGIAARAAFQAAGGERLGVMPCLNESPEWIEALADIGGRTHRS